jgi:protocatechuate 3,4-dioxygenase beta subunit
MLMQDRKLSTTVDVFSARSISRRQALGVMLGMAWSLGSRTTLAEALQNLCLPTPAQTEGPFYPVHDQPEKDNDLTRLKGSSGRATGQVLYILGQVRDAQCRPIEGALVEIWQASANGRYHHPEDQDERRPLDPHFQYWGYDRTDRDGRYRFITILPAPYPAGPFWTRPAHVHFKVHRRNFPMLTTQMYFAGDPYLEKDRIFQRIPPPERPRVVVETQKAPPDFEPGALLCYFDLTL